MTNAQAVLLLLCSEEWKQELISLLDSQSTDAPKTRKRTKKRASKHNLTAQYIEREYESLHKRLMSLSFGKASADDAKDFIQGFLADLVRKDTLASRLSQGERVKYSVLASWYKQYMTRQWQYFGKDCSTRTFTGARSQLEEKTGKSHVWVDPSPAKIVPITDEGGNVLDTDFNVDHDSYESEAEKEIFAQDVSRIVRGTLLDTYGERADHLFRVFEARRDESYKTKAEWARQWGISRSQLDRDINQVEDAILSLGRECFGL